MVKEKRKRKRKIRVIPYYRWNSSALLRYGITVICWLVLLEIAAVIELPHRVIMVIAAMGAWILGAWFLWLRSEAQVYPPDPRLNLPEQ